MSRRGRPSGKRGPDLAWDDEVEDLAATPISKKPDESFPEIAFPVPRPLTTIEIADVKAYLHLRDSAHHGPYHARLDPRRSAFVKDHGRDRRPGIVDPFNDQERYSARYHKKQRTVPELGGFVYALHLFPHELWPLLDPTYQSPLWQAAGVDVQARPDDAPRTNLKRKRSQLVMADDDDEGDATGRGSLEGYDDANQSDGSDSLVSGFRRSRKTKAARRRREGNKAKNAREKQRLDAEDELSEDEVVQPRPGRRKNRPRGSDDEDNEDDDDGDGDHPEPGDSHHAHEHDVSGGDDDDDGSTDGEPVDSEYEESIDGDGDDYNAENYFETGEGDDDDAGGGDDEEGGTFFMNPGY